MFFCAYCEKALAHNHEGNFFCVNHKCKSLKMDKIKKWREKINQRYVEVEKNIQNLSNQLSSLQKQRDEYIAEIKQYDEFFEEELE